MGGCCCCASRGLHHNATSSFYYLPRVLEERQHLASHHGSNSALSTGLLVDTNLDTSICSSYRSPPIPIPYNIDMGHPQTPPYIQQITSSKGNSALPTPNSSMAEIMDSDEVIETTIADRDLKKMDSKGQTYLENVSSEKLQNMVNVAQSKSVVSSLEEEDVCPTCLEEYNEENPRIVAKCEHHFHLACILEWMERSEFCPVCDKEMIFTSYIPG